MPGLCHAIVLGSLLDRVSLLRAWHPRSGASCRPGPAGDRGVWVLPGLQLRDTHSLPVGDGVRRRMLGDLLW